MAAYGLTMVTSVTRSSAAMLFTPGVNIYQQSVVNFINSTLQEEVNLSQSLVLFHKSDSYPRPPLLFQRDYCNLNLTTWDFTSKSYYRYRFAVHPKNYAHSSYLFWRLYCNYPGSHVSPSGILHSLWAERPQAFLLPAWWQNRFSMCQMQGLWVLLSWFRMIIIFNLFCDRKYTLQIKSSIWDNISDSMDFFLDILHKLFSPYIQNQHLVNWLNRNTCMCNRIFSGIDSEINNLLLAMFFTYETVWMKKLQIDGSVQDCSNSIANALELLQSCTKPSTLSSRMVWVRSILIVINSMRTRPGHFSKSPICSRSNSNRQTPSHSFMVSSECSHLSTYFSDMVDEMQEHICKFAIMCQNSAVIRQMLSSTGQILAQIWCIMAWLQRMETCFLTQASAAILEWLWEWHINK